MLQVRYDWVKETNLSFTYPTPKLTEVTLKNPYKANLFPTAYLIAPQRTLSVIFHFSELIIFLISKG